MWFWIKYYTNWVLASVFGYVIPWWLWGVVGVAGAIALFLLLPQVIPERWRLTVSSFALTIGVCVSAMSWGIDHGIHLERTKWANIVSREVLRLKMDAEANLKAEQQRADSAELHNKILQGQLDALDDETASTPPATCDKPVVSESHARRLRNLTGRRR